MRKTKELDNLLFTPTAHQVAPDSVVTTGITLAVSNDGGPGVTSISSITATAVNDAPSITGAKASQTTTDEASLKPFSTVTISDPDAGVDDSVTITLTNDALATDADGTLTGSGLTKTGTGTYLLAAATPGALTTELESLVFTPTAHQVAPGAAVTTGVSVTASQTAGGLTVSATSSTSVTATAVNDAPTITGAVAGQTTTAGTAIKPFGSVDITDPDNSVSDSLTITLKNSAGAATDADGKVTGTGLTKTGTGSYSLAAATPSYRRKISIPYEECGMRKCFSHFRDTSLIVG